MQLTFEAVWFPSKNQKEIIQDHMRRFQSVKRIAFNRLLEGQIRQPIVTQIRQLDLLSNARYIRSAIDEAKALILAQHELVDLSCQEAAWKVQQATADLKQYQQTLNQKQGKLSKKEYQILKGFHTRLQKTETTLTKWQTHQKNKTIPSIVFGGKKILRLYQQGKISKEEWIKRRNNGIYCVGEKSRQGNANLRLHYDPTTNSFTFSMLLDRGKKNDRLRAPMYVPNKYKPLFKRLTQGILAYTIRVLSSATETSFRVLVTADQTTKIVPNNNGMAGIDLNPTGIAVSLVYPNGNYRCSKWFSCPDLMYARKKKRDWLVGNVVKEVFKWIDSYQLNSLSLESLHFSKRFGTKKRFNRIRANFVHKKFIQTIQAQAIRQKMMIKEINPAYTSILGKNKYQCCYGLNIHQAAALVIARRGLGFNEKLYAHIKGKRMVLVVPPMEGWASKQIRRLSREIDEFTAHLSNSTSKVHVGSPQLLTRRQGLGGGIVPRSHTLTPGKSALVHPGV